MPPAPDLTGQTFGRWRIAGRAGTHDGRATWHCVCDPDLGGCGAAGVVRTEALRRGGSTKCEACRNAELGTHGDVGGANLAAHKTTPTGERTCPRCRRPFEAVGRQVYCSPACRHADADPGHDRCAYCEGLMDRLGYRRLYCSRRCKRLAAKAVEAARLAEARRAGVAEDDFG